MNGDIPSDDLVRRIAIVGAGLTGWMAAATLARMLPRGRYAIRLIATKDADRDPVGVDSTLPGGHEFHDMLGLAEDRLICEAQASFALGSAWSNWAYGGETYFSPFGDVGASLDGVGFLQIIARLRKAGRHLRPGNYTFATIMAQLGRFARPSADPRSILSTYGYGLHLPLENYTDLLRGLALELGVEWVDGVYQACTRDEDGGIASVLLEDGRCVEGDLFLDCSGTRGLLTAGALETGFESWRKWLPCDAVVSVVCRSDVPPAVYSHNHPLTWGWHGVVPAQGVTGQAIVFCSDLLPPDVAETQLRERLTGRTLGDAWRNRFESGRRTLAWNRNCIALGDAAAVLEPFPAARLHLAQRQLIRLVRLFPQTRSSPVEAAEYNRQTSQEAEHLRDFLILRYKFNARLGNEKLWNDCREMEVPEPLAHKIAIWSSRGRVPLYDEETFEETDWALLLDTHQVRPNRYDPRADAIPVDRLNRHVDRLSELILSNASALPFHRDYLRQLCAAEAAR